MGKRSNFERKPRDLYPTPYEAVIPLLPHLKAGTIFDEPCCGNGALMNHLENSGHFCEVWADIFPLCDDAVTRDVLHTVDCSGACFITNPPWAWPILTQIITRLSAIAPTWLLLNSDLMHNKRMAPHLKRCAKIVSIGRVKWEPGSKSSGMENSAWYLFDVKYSGPTVFFGRITL